MSSLTKFCLVATLFCLAVPIPNVGLNTALNVLSLATFVVSWWRDRWEL